MIASSMFIGKHILLYHLMDTLPSLTEIFEILFVKIFEMKSLNKTGRSARRNSCILSSIFPAGEGGFGQMMYRSPERSPQDSRDRCFLYSAQASFSWARVDLTRPLRRTCSRSFWIISFEFVKVCGIRFSNWESFIGFYICCYPISTILACLFSVGV